MNKLKTKTPRAVQAINLPREICHWCLGHDHHISHRMIVGLMVMAVGVIIAKAGHHYPGFIAHASDLIGFFIHALGAVPYLEWLIEE